MDSTKTLEFNGTAGGYFVVFIVTLISAYIPLFGWAFGFNFMNSWLAESTLVNGRKVVYKAGYGETLKFLFINLLLTVITLGIYIFWFTPKSYRFAADHVSYADETAAAPVPPAAPVEAEASATIAPTTNPTPPTTVEPTEQPPQPPAPTSPIQ